MGVRKQCNRYKAAPFGTDFENVVKRAKRFLGDGVFMVSQYGHVYHSAYPSLPPFKNPENAVFYRKIGRKWEVSNGQ